MQILFDTSIWISHLKKSNELLVSELEQDNVLIHEAILGELAVGNIPKRTSFLNDLSKLPVLETLSYKEVLYFIEKHSLYGIGLSWIDVNLITSCLVKECDLVTNDKILDKTWRKIIE